MILLSEPHAAASGALHAIFELFGENGCRHYAKRVQAHRTTISRGLQDRNSSLARTLDLVLSLFLTARDLGAEPLALLQCPWTGEQPLIVPMERHLGPEAVSMLSDRIARTHRAVSHGLTNADAYLWPHFEVILTVMEFIAKQGGCLVSALARRIHTPHSAGSAPELPITLARMLLPAGPALAV